MGSNLIADKVYEITIRENDIYDSTEFQTQATEFEKQVKEQLIHTLTKMWETAVKDQNLFVEDLDELIQTKMKATNTTQFLRETTSDNQTIHLKLLKELRNVKNEIKPFLPNKKRAVTH